MNKKKVFPAYFPSRLKEIVQSFALLSIIWLLLILTVRVLELVINQYNHPVQSDFLLLLGWSWYADFIFWADYILICLPGFLLIGFLSLKAAKIIFKVFIGLFIFTHILLISYFNTSLVLLGGDLFSYSRADIIHTVGASGGGEFTFRPYSFGNFVIDCIVSDAGSKENKIKYLCFSFGTSFPPGSLFSGNN